jgi:hypothetical protein
VSGGRDVDYSDGAWRGGGGSREQSGKEAMGEKEMGEVVCLFYVINREVKEEEGARTNSKLNFESLGSFRVGCTHSLYHIRSTSLFQGKE